jgi:hypothetical protein
VERLNYFSSIEVLIMFNNDTELLFPSRIIPELRLLRKEKWRWLVDLVSGTEPTSIEHSAFVLMMVRLSGCITCNADSFRAMRGCTQCARQTVKRFRGDDQDLIQQFNQAKAEIDASIKKN